MEYCLDIRDESSEIGDPKPCVMPCHEWHPLGTDIMFDDM